MDAQRREIDLQKYEVNLPYPTKAEYTTRYYYRAGQCVATLRARETFYAVSDAPPLEQCVSDVVVDVAAYDAAVDAYQEAQAERLRQFEADLYAWLRLEQHPARKIIFRRAWDRTDGAAQGLEAVLDAASDYAELLRQLERVTPIAESPTT